MNKEVNLGFKETTKEYGSKSNAEETYVLNLQNNIFKLDAVRHAKMLL
jgi:hypothetical protein